MPHFRIQRKRIPVGTLPPTPCQYDWRDGCDKTATWRVGCGPNVRFYCDSHEGPPCGGVFFDEFVITPDTTREELVGVVSCGFHRINSASGRDVHDLRCCACWEWIGDTQSRNCSFAAPFSRFSKRADTGTLVPVNTQAPLSLPGTLSTAGHVSQFVIRSPRFPSRVLLPSRQGRGSLRTYPPLVGCLHLLDPRFRTR